MEPHYTAHILSHTHWDREWYLNSPYTNEWLIPFFEGLFAMFEKEPSYKFILDGQLSMIEDYFEELSKNGRSVSQAKRALKDYVRRGSLFIGPYYLQPDWQLLSEEALVRNLMIGRKMADRLGGSIETGWLLDNFGQISQTAQIHRLAGLTGIFVWRGVSMDPEHVRSEFYWESPDGTRLLSVYLLNSYRNVMRLAEYESIMNLRMDAEVAKLKPFATTRHLLMMNGYDQEMVPDDIQPLIRSERLDGKDYTTIQDDPDSYIRAIAADCPELPTLSGALYEGRFISVFPGVMSTRMYLKLQNDQMQRLLEQKLEPIALMAWMMGDEYGSTQIEQAWKILLKNHPHDSICGVSIDDVHKDMEARNRQVHALATSLLEDRLAYLAGAIDSSQSPSEDAMIIFNTAPYERSCTVIEDGKATYVKAVPAMGYTVCTAEDTPEQNLVIEHDFKVSNTFLELEINPNGSFDVLCKATGTRYRDLGSLEDMGDSGDEYNYSYPDIDSRILSTAVTAAREIVLSAESIVTFRISFEMDIPISDCEGHTQRSTETLKMPIVTYVTIEADSPVVTCRTTVRNTVRDHRVRVLFPTGITTEVAHAGSPFDITDRPITLTDFDESQIPEQVRQVIVGAREAKPSTYFHTRDLVDLNDGIQGLAVFNRGIPEYQVIDGDSIALTLFRSVGWIAKNINTRIGDAGPEIYTPDAQCLREMTFEYAVYPHAGNVDAKVSSYADRYTREPIVIHTPASQHSTLSGNHSWFTFSSMNDCVKITGIKRSEDGRAAVMRGVNLSEKSTRATLWSDLELVKAELVDLHEQPISTLATSGSTVEISLSGKEIFTLKLIIDRQPAHSSTLPAIILSDEKTREDFSLYPYTDHVTEADIAQERDRSDDLKSNIADPMFRRTALEAQLSVILTENKIHEGKIRELGYQLNEARVQRRIHDYINSNFSET